MTIPTRYEDLTIEQFMQLEELKTSKLDAIDKAVKRVSILTGKDVNEIGSLTPKEVYKTLEKATFLMLPIHAMPVKKKMRFGLKQFKHIESLTELSTAQNKDYTHFLESNNGNYIACLPEILALTSKELTITGYKYKQENHFKNVDLFKKAKLKDVLGNVFFYSNYSKSYNKILKDSSELLEKQIEEMKKDKEFLSSLKSGDGNTQ